MNISASITKNAFAGGNAGVSGGKDDLRQKAEPLALSSSGTEIETPLPEAPSTVTLTPTPPAMRRTAQLDMIPRCDDGFDDLPSPSALILGGINNGPLDGKGNTNPNEADPGLFDLSDDYDWINLDESWPHPANAKQTANHAHKNKSIYVTHQETEPVDPFTTKNRHCKRPLPSPGSTEPRSKQTKTLQSDDKLASLSEGLRREDILVESTTMNVKPATTEPTKGWEKIDPSLLDEFKDIVNFF